MTTTTAGTTVKPMTASTATPPRHRAVHLPTGARAVLATVWLTFVTTVLLALAFSFGNVWDLNRTLGVERHVAPLVGPAVDLTAIGLLIAVPWFVLAGVDRSELRSANWLMRLAGFLTLALNSGPAALSGAWGRALVEAIVPTLLIAWSHVGPVLIGLYVRLRDGAVERSSQAAEERSVEVAAAVALAREESAAETAELAAQVASLDASLREAEERHAAEMEASREAVSKAQDELREARKDAHRKPVSGGSRKPAERAPRRSEDEWVDLAKERLPEWQIETPVGSVIGSALDLSSAGTISKIRQRLEADRLALTEGGAQ